VIVQCVEKAQGEKRRAGGGASGAKDFSPLSRKTHLHTSPFLPVCLFFFSSQTARKKGEETQRKARRPTHIDVASYFVGNGSQLKRRPPSPPHKKAACTALLPSHAPEKVRTGRSFS